MKNLFINMTLKMKLVLNAVFMLVMMAAITGISFYSMNNINNELDLMVKRDLPITEKVTAIVINKLEQAVLFEKSIHYGAILNSEATARDDLKESIKNFDDLTNAIDDEVRLIVSEVDNILSSSQSEKELAEFTHVKNVVKNINKEHKEYIVHAHETFGLYREGKSHEAEIYAKSVEKEEKKIDQAIEELAKELEKFTYNAIKSASKHEQDAVRLLLIILLIAGVITLIVSWYLVKSITQGLSTTAGYLDSITKGDLEEEILITGNGQDEIGRLLNSMKVMQKQLKQRLVDDAEEAKTGTARIKSALDAVATNVMVADENNNIIYMNKSLINMFNVAADDIRKDLPRFDEKNLMGGNMDQFHKNPAHQKGLIGSLTQTVKAEIEVGGRTFGLVAAPVFNEDGDRLGTAVEWNDRTEELKALENEKRIVNEALRVQSSLAAVTSNVMIADAGNNIVFVNESLNKMFDIAQNDIRKDLPNFDKNALIGSNIDIFHKNPAHQQRLVGGLTESIKAEIVVGGRTFGLVATPVFNDEGERLGTAVEWSDRTNELQVEQEVENVVTAAANGDLSKRLSMEGKTGFFKNVSEGINQLASVCDDVIQDTIRVFGAMADGNLTEKIEKEYQGSFEQLKNDANATVNKFVQVVNEIQNTAASVNTGASEISIGNQSLSQRNEEQASSLEETASSMEEMTSTVRQNADNANQANQLAVAARNQAEKGGEVVASAVNAMSEINTSSKKVADIISVIDEIAFQTNLLALNAAVEAARAGEQGRGFAVVASEVRNLAQRSAGAAKEIKDLIEESVSKVDEGSELVNASGETLEEIVNGIKKVSDIVAEIAAASAEQASGIDQVNKAVTQLDDMTQQNAALVEEAAAASEAMQDQAEGLSELMTFFSTGNDSGLGVVKAKPEAGAPKPVQRPAKTAKVAASGGGQSKPKAVPDNEDWEEF